MAFSASADIKLTAADIIQEAMELIGVLEEGESPSAAQNTTALRSLNNIIKLWSADTQIYAQAEYRLNLVADTQSYSLDATNVGYIPNRVIRVNRIEAEYYDSANLTVPYDTLAVSTFTVGETVTFSGGSTAIVITDNATDSMTVRLAEGDATPANDETITGGTSGATAAVNGTATALTQSGARGETPLRELTQEQWYALGDKSVTGQPTQFYQQRQPVGVSHIFKIWPTPDDTTYDLLLWLQYPYQDADATTDDVWFTQEWYMALSFELAYVLSNKYGLHPQERMMFAQTAARYYDLAATYDTEGSMYLQPDSKHA
jgi:hypothetical protein